MIEAKVPKDIRAYETKIIGPFTLRQVICLLIMIAVDLVFFFAVLKPFHISSSYIMYIIILVDVPIAAFGWIKPSGIPLEKYLKSFFVHNFLAPKRRKVSNKIVDTDRERPSDKEKKKAQKGLNKMLKTHPELRPYK